jgi:NitT/TauT family transport system substrate-binding protein
MRTPIRVAGNLLVAACLLGACLAPVQAHSRDSAGLVQVSQMMNFFPEPEEGGEYAAVALGIYKKHGLSAPIVAFPSSAINAIPYVATGKVDFGMAGADEVLQARQQGIPIVTLFAIYQTTEFGLMWHAEDKTIRSLADLSNHSVIYVLGSPFWKYLQQKYHYRNVHQFNYDFSLRLFLAKKDSVNQVSVTSEPYLAMKAGAKVKAASLATTGFNPYGNVVFTTEREIQRHPDVVRAFVKATLEGWQAYFKNPTPINRVMQTAAGSKNYPLTLDAMQFDVVQSRPLIQGGDAAHHGIGAMTLTRWTTLKQQLQSVGIKLDKVDVTKAFTTQFLP